MSLGTKIPVDLSDARAARIARGLFEKLDREEHEESARPERKTPGRMWMMVSAAAVAAAALLFVVERPHVGAPSPRLEANPSRVVTGAMGSHLAFGDVAFDVGPESELVASGNDDAGMLVVLARGSITCDVAPRGGRPPFIVQAGGVRVRVVGTRFRVTREGEGARVSVAHGTVEVSAQGTTARVSDGESWPLGSQSAGVVAATSPTASPTASPPPAATSGADASSRPWLPRTAPIVAAAAPLRQAASSASLAPPVATAPASSSLADESPLPNVKPSTPAPETSQELFERAAQLEGHDASRAISIYRKLTFGHSVWAANALFAEASLEQARGNQDEARRLLEAYVARYPQGPNARDAHAILERLK